MPQKPVFSKAPLLDIPHSFLSNGLIRTDDARIDSLYRNASVYSEYPCLWEGLFCIACLLKKNPMAEPVVLKITQALKEKEEGAFKGKLTEQIHIARAAFSLYEYTVDRSILKRIASWFRYLEIEFDRLSLEDGLLFHAADLMELLVRYYQVTGLKSVLRLCSLLRAASFDWTTALHTFQQSIPIKNEAAEFSLDGYASPDQINFDEKEKIINHAELLADGIRFTLFSGIFSGNRQDLFAGHTAWRYLMKRHRALCGGTTGDPFLLGKAADKAVSTSTLLAWAEAFASQMYLNNDAWAADELIRIVFNGLDYCINTDKIPEKQWVNQLKKDTSDQAVNLLGRITRTVACIYRHAVTITHNGIRINYLIPCRMIHTFEKKTVILNMTYHDIRFESNNSFNAEVELFVSSTETAEIFVLCKDKQINIMHEKPCDSQTGIYLHTEKEWFPGEGYCFKQGDAVISEETNHQGVCFFVRNRLMSLPVNGQFFPVAVSGQAVCSGGKTAVKVGKLTHWKEENGNLRDIPVLPEIQDSISDIQLEPYSSTDRRISMFPRGKKHE